MHNTENTQNAFNAHGHHDAHVTQITERYDGERSGGKARKAAESKGLDELQQYEAKVETLLWDEDLCPAGFDWFNMHGGYLCGAGNHWISHDEIDRSLTATDVHESPHIESVNCVDDDGYCTAAVHPPHVAHHLPMHDAHRRYMDKLQTCGQAARVGRREEEHPRHPCRCVERREIDVVKNGGCMERLWDVKYAQQGYFDVIHRGGRLRA
ncbi:hypothetical protein LTR85_010356 [Meristemomyces frigidus]|nr:hypothetical protein LTR85_010356 [Meristemomyces frigidus]